MNNENPPDDRATERHTPTEAFLKHAHEQRTASLATALVLAACGVPILRQQAPEQEQAEG